MPIDVSMHADGATIARTVRHLALRAHRVLDEPSDEVEARLVFESIEGLEREIEPGSAPHLELWLASLRRRIVGRMPTPA